MPQIELPDEPAAVERAHCSYAERNCLRRDRDGTVPAVDEYGTALVETCMECNEMFCVAHRHSSQRRGSNYCNVHGYHPRCVVTVPCMGCDRRFCEAVGHEQDDADCEDFQSENDESDEDRGYTSYSGPYREAELLFEGDTPVPGLAEGERYVSFEVEAEIDSGEGGEFTLPHKFGITGDGSLSNGVEITFPPSRMDALVENAHTVVDALQGGGYYTPNSCGMHMHIDLRDKVNDDKFLSHLFATFYAVEDILFAMQRQRRENNSYCMPLRNGWRFYDAYGTNAADFDFTYYKTPRTIDSKRQLAETKRYKGGPRYNAFNFHSVYYRGSLEIRLHEGMLNADSMLKWAEVIQKIVARVEKGVTYPTLRKLLEMPVHAQKLRLFYRVFGIPLPLQQYIEARIVAARGALGFRLPRQFDLGTPVKGRAKSLLPVRRFKATHRACRWCGAVVRMERRCQFCRRDPQFTPDENGWADEPGMYYRSGSSRSWLSQRDWESLTVVRTSGAELEF